MQNAFKHEAHILKPKMQQGKMKLHAHPSKFHVEHAPNRATVQHIHTIKVSTTICPKQQLSTLQSRKQHATGNIWAQT